MRSRESDASKPTHRIGLPLPVRRHCTLAPNRHVGLEARLAHAVRDLDHPALLQQPPRLIT
jgi:hypothetical protein